MVYCSTAISQKGRTNMDKLTPLKAIRRKCIECCNGQQVEVRRCTCENCPLYGYRMGHRPKDEQNTVEAF